MLSDWLRAPYYRHHFVNQTETWMAAAGQILFSYAVCQGSLTSLGSYNKWSFNSMKWTAKLRKVHREFETTPKSSTGPFPRLKQRPLLDC